MILITVGILIILNKITAFGFSRSWPILLIVIGIGTLVQRVRDLGGWFLVAAGVIFLLIYNWQMDIQIISTYILPGLLIVIGINILRKYFRKKS
jgi:hypothetical protein